MADPRTVVAGPPPGGWSRARHRRARQTTQTYGYGRDLDVARAMVLEYLATAGTPTSADAVIEWVETGT
ncbi:hypothetical protein GS935_16455 [Rhodococcus hoagii]|nr:hypothetical protein [Prescottella equi]